MATKPQSDNLADPILGKAIPLPESLKVEYQDESGSNCYMKVRNLSRGGICIENDVCLPPGTCLRILLNVVGKTIKAQGEVIWIAKRGFALLHGIQFTFMAQPDREWLNTFIMDWAAEQIAPDLDFSGLPTVPVATAMERRLFARLNIPLRVDFGFQEDTVLIRDRVQNISEGGLCLISNFELKKEQKLYLRLWLRDKKFIPLSGIVRYSAKKIHENQKVNFHGVEFTQMANSAAKEITEFLNQKRSELTPIEITLNDIVGQSHPEGLT